VDIEVTDEMKKQQRSQEAHAEHRAKMEQNVSLRSLWPICGIGAARRQNL